VYLFAVACLHHSGTRTRPPLPQEPPTFLRFVVEVTAGLIAYDLLFSPIHWALHAPELRHKFALSADAAAAARTAVTGADQATALNGHFSIGLKVVARSADSWSGRSSSSLCVALSNPLGWVMTRPFLSRCIANVFSGPATSGDPAAVSSNVASGAPRTDSSTSAAPSASIGSSLEESGAVVRRRFQNRSGLPFVATKLQRGLAGLRRRAAHGKHHTMKGVLQVGVVSCTFSRLLTCLVLLFFASRVL